MRTRAAEFLGLTGVVDPMPMLFTILDQSTDPIEANLILNSVVLLRDGSGFKVDPKKVKGAAWAKLGGQVGQRVSYLAGDDASEAKNTEKEQDAVE